MRALIIIAALLLAGCGERTPSRHERLLNDGCTLESRVKTGRSNYCGKACWTPEIVATYNCPAMKRSFVE